MLPWGVYLSDLVHTRVGRVHLEFDTRSASMKWVILNGFVREFCRCSTILPDFKEYLSLLAAVEEGPLFRKGGQYGHVESSHVGVSELYAVIGARSLTLWVFTCASPMARCNQRRPTGICVQRPERATPCSSTST